MRTLNSLKSASWKMLTGALFIVASYTLLLAAPQISADQASTDPVQQECFNKVDSKIRSAVCAGDAHKNVNIVHARNGASYKCRSKTDTAELSKCITASAKAYIAKTAASNPKTASKFTAKLDSLIKKDGGDPKNATKNSKHGQAAKTSNDQFNTGAVSAHGDSCGGGDNAVHTSINFGCRGAGNPIADATFAIIRVLSDGVGLVIIASLVYGGIQYSASRGDPQATAMAVARLRSNVLAIIIFIFGYAMLNFIIPAGFLGS
jgi:hypothetical protein